MLSPDPLLTQEEIELITLPTKNGNPDFDLETERRVWVRPFAPSDGRIHPFKNPRASILKFDRFMAINGRDEIRMFVLETDPDNGYKVVRDKYGNPVVRQVPSEDDPSKLVPHRLVLSSGPQEPIEFQLPRDRYIFEEYLLKCPRNASVDYIDNQPNNIFPYRFYIEDPLSQRKIKKARRAFEQEAVEYVRGLQDHQLEAFSIYFGISAVLDEGDDIATWFGELRYQLEKLARQNSEDFLIRTKHNKNLVRELLFAQAMHKRVIISRGENGYFYVPEDGKRKQVQIGFTKEAVFGNWESDPRLYHTIVRQSGFEFYLGTSSDISDAKAETSISTIEIVKEKEKQLSQSLAEVEEMKKQLAELMQQANKNLGVSQDHSKEFVPKTVGRRPSPKK